MKFEWRGRQRPDLRGVVFALRGQVSLREDLEGIAAIFFCRQCRDSPLKFVEAAEASEQS